MKGKHYDHIYFSLEITRNVYFSEVHTEKSFLNLVKIYQICIEFFFKLNYNKLPFNFKESEENKFIPLIVMTNYLMAKTFVVMTTR